MFGVWRASIKRTVKDETMKRRHAVPVIASLALFVLLGFVRSSSVAAGNKPTLSKKELKALIASAKTKDDHQKLADYYKAEKERLEGEAKDHEDLAKAYDENPGRPSMGSRTPFGQGASHCHRQAQLYTDQAKEAEALAALHEDMAKAATQ